MAGVKFMYVCHNFLCVSKALKSLGYYLAIVGLGIIVGTSVEVNSLDLFLVRKEYFLRKCILTFFVLL